MALIDDFFGRRTASRLLVVTPYAGREHPQRRDEFIGLCEAADFETVGITAVHVRDPHPGTFFRGGAIERINEHIVASGADLVAVDHALTPVQQRQLERSLGRGVLDRPAIILTIFGRRARSRAGRLQVAVAQHQYLLPRLKGMWHHFDRERGGIGQRGAGEKQLELDRRMIEQQLKKLRRELHTVRRTRHLHRHRRKRRRVPQVAVVGYTNAGKSTLIGRLADRDIFARDMPFATLDPLTRRVQLKDRTEFLITDTVGFVQDLPVSLIEAFKSTLEETLEADILLHVADLSAPDVAKQIATTEEVLDSLGVGRELPVCYVLNKTDLCRTRPAALADRLRRQPYALTSVTRDEGLDAVAAWLRKRVLEAKQLVRVRIPLDRPDVIARAEHRADGPGKWGQAAVEYDVPAESALATEWAV